MVRFLPAVALVLLGACAGLGGVPNGNTYVGSVNINGAAGSPGGVKADGDATSRQTAEPSTSVSVEPPEGLPEVLADVQAAALEARRAAERARAEAGAE